MVPALQTKEDQTLSSPTANPGNQFDSAEPMNAKNNGSNEQKTSAKTSDEVKKMFATVIAEVKTDHELLATLRSHGIELKRETGYWVANCPFPNHSDSSPSFKVKINSPHNFVCYGCQAHGDVIDFVRDINHLNGVGDAIKYLTGISVDDYYKKIKSRKESKNTAAASAASRNDDFAGKPETFVTASEQPGGGDNRNQELSLEDLERATDVYIALLALLTLDPVHIDQLQKRGISEEEGRMLGYRSLPVDRNTRIQICKRLKQSGYDLKNIPGFFRLPPKSFAKGQFCLGGDRFGFRDIKDGDGNIHPCHGLLIPTRDLYGRIRRLKIRNDAPPAELPEELKQRFPERYMSFSSNDRSDGAKSGSWVHVARPFYKKTGSQPETLWITEGEIKADVSALFLGETVLGLPGVGQCPELAIATAVEGGFTEICVAMDSEEKAHVKLAIARIINLAKEKDIAVNVAVWHEEKGKGLDDLLAGGSAPEVISPDSWWNTLTYDQKVYVTQRINGRCSVKSNQN